MEVGDPRAGVVPRPGGVTNSSIQSLFFATSRSHVMCILSAWPSNPLRWGESCGVG